MSGIALIFVVGLLNLCLGYAMAGRLGYGHARGAWARRTAVAEPSPPSSADDAREPQDVFASDEPVDVDESALDDLIRELVCRVEPEEADGEQASDDAFDPGEEAESSGSESPLGAGDASAGGRLLAVRQDVDRHLDWLIELDTRIRRTAGDDDLFTLLAWLEELKEGCHRHLGRGPGGEEPIAERIEALDAGSQIAQKLFDAAAEHSSRLEEAAAYPERAELKGDLQAATAGLLEEIDRLQTAAHRLRAALDESFLAAARREGRLHAIDASLKIDSLTQFPSRVGLESALLEWWQAGGARTRPLAAVLFDLDCFAEVNGIHGLKASEGILRATAEWIGGHAGDNELVARYGGKQLLLLVFDRAAGEALERAEQVRQSIAASRFVRGGAEIRVTLSVGVAAALPRQAPQRLLDRLEAAVAAAKQSGRNCTFLDDGRQADLADPAELKVESRQVFV